MLTRRSMPAAAAAAATVGIGYGISVYKQAQAERQHALYSKTSSTAAAKRASEEAMMNAYGDRGSLEELEAAIAAYDSHRKR